LMTNRGQGFGGKSPLSLQQQTSTEVAVLHCRYAGVFASIVSVCSALENGRYGNAPSDPIRVLLALVFQPLALLDQAGGLENAAYTQLVAHVDH